MRRWIWLVCVLALAQDDPLIRVNTRLVEVDVVVRNGDGPVGGLTREDFTVFDNGRPQEIAAFSVRVGQGRQRARAPLRTGEISNRANARGEEVAGATIILMDGLSNLFEDQSRANQQVLDYLATREPGEWFALYGLTSKLRVLQDFTDDPAVLRRAMAESSPEAALERESAGMAQVMLDGMGSGSTGDAITDAMQVNMVKDLADRYLRRSVELTTAALEEIARHLSGLPGRKKLIWVTSGFPASQFDIRSRNGQPLIETMSFGREIDRAVRALNDANIAVYPVDARGLTVDARELMGQGLVATGLDTMNLFAGGTGGRAFYADNGLVEGVRSAVEEAETTYTLAFYPRDVKLDGTYHSIDVKVAGRGVDLRHRKGYFASAETVPREKVLGRSIQEAFASDLEETGIGLSAIAAPVVDAPGFYRVDVTINLNELRVEQNNGRWVADIDFATRFADEKVGTREHIVIRLAQDRFLQAIENGYTIPRLVDAGDASGKFRIVIQDRATGRVGSVRVPLGAQ